jgi:hypothetical protein
VLQVGARELEELLEDHGGLLLVEGPHGAGGGGGGVRGRKVVRVGRRRRRRRRLGLLAWLFAWFYQEDRPFDYRTVGSAKSNGRQS